MMAGRRPGLWVIGVMGMGMERAVIVIAGTVAGVVGVLTYVPRPLAAADALPEAPVEPVAAASAAPAAVPSASASPAPPVVQTIAGPLVETAFGPLQVEVTIQDGEVTAAEATTYPDKDPKSITIAKKALPLLAQETITAQSADIAVVSGASYTSDGWKQSLLGALEQAGLAPAATAARPE